jgi:hypothetical protein
MNQRAAKWIIRTCLVVLSLVIFGILAICGRVIFEAMQPEPGAEMVLMALPFLIGIAFVPCVLIVLIVLTCRSFLSRVERIVFFSIALTVGLPAIPLFVLG